MDYTPIESCCVVTLQVDETPVCAILGGHDGDYELSHWTRVASQSRRRVPTDTESCRPF
jgi:predicted Fe-S protein YdhL (DUF1289 family)